MIAAPPRQTLLLTPARTRPDITVWLAAAWAALLPIQLTWTTMVKFAPADLFLALAIFFRPGYWKFHGYAWSAWHLALIILFAASTLLVTVERGNPGQYVLVNKDCGLLALLLAYSVLTSVLTSWDRIRRVGAAFVIGVVVQNLFGIAAWIAANKYGIQTPLTSDNGVRLCGWMIDANAYGGLLVAALVFCEGASQGRAPLFRPLFLMFVRVTLGIGIILSFSRSSWVSLGAAFALLFVMRPKIAFRALLITAAGAAATLIVLGDRFLRLASTMAFRPEVTTGLGRGRWELIVDGLADFSRHPFFGAGVGTFFTLEHSIVHNTPVWFLTEFGLLGLTIFAGLMAWFAVREWTAYRHAPSDQRSLVLGMMLANFGMLVFSLGIEAFYQRHWWLMMALISSSYGVTRRAGRRSPDGNSI